MRDLKNKTAVITTGGIRLGIARALPGEEANEAVSGVDDAGPGSAAREIAATRHRERTAAFSSPSAG